MCMGGKEQSDKKILKIITKNLESEGLSWPNPDCDKLKDHVACIHVSFLQELLQ